MRRYWDPGASARWLTADEIGEFDGAFERAVKRCVAGRPAIFLSGGFDSVSVAAVVADLARRDARTSPHALSLGFPAGAGGEGFVQRSVAHALDLSQDFVEFDAAVAPHGLMRSALALGASWPLPMLNTWAPAYLHLGRLAAARGCTTILTGTGGDEWLNVSPMLAADLIRQGHFREVAQLGRIYRRSFRLSTAAIARTVVWRCGLRPLAAAAVDAAAPRWNASRRAGLLVRATPDWIAPDPLVRRAIDERAHGALLAARPPQGFYQQQMQIALDHPLVALEYEEQFEFGRRLGLRMLHPYLDADLVALLYRTPPALLTKGGRTKAMVRAAVARRFPTLGFDVQRKTDATTFLRRKVCTEGADIWKATGGASALSELGVVNVGRMSAEVNSLLAGERPHESYRIWNVMNLEAWARARM
jgi:asparagine synthase (glutamine-hydrolysing)